MSGTTGSQLGLTRQLCAVAACVILCVSTSQASADTIEIFFTGIDIAYDGSDIVDADPSAADPDPIVNASFVINGGLAGTVSTNVTADLFIEDVAVLLNQTVMSTGAGSYFQLNFPDGSDADSDADFLRLSLDDVMVTFIDSAPKDFVFSASVADGFSRSDSLPFDALFDPSLPITLSFSSQTSAVTLGAPGVVTSFAASGTGEVRGEFDPDMNQVIPEPASIGMVVLAGLMGGVYAMRRRLG
jgi:hypothetical protein